MKQADDIIAIITAAITAFLGGNSSIVVKSIRRLPDNTNTWTMAGRRRQMRAWNKR